MFWQWPLLLSSGLLCSSKTLVSAFPQIDRLDYALEPRVEVAVSHNRRQLSDTTAIIPTKAVGPREVGKPYYRLCKRKDAEGCMIELSCKYIKYITAPFTILVMGIREIEYGGPAISFSHLVPPLLIYICDAVQKNHEANHPQNPKSQRSLALVPRDDEKPLYYRFCRREDGQGCELDIGCNLIKYVTAPILTVLFGIRQYQDGLHIFPADLVMPITILSCNQMQRNIDESIPPKSNDRRSLALIPRDNDKPLYYRFCRREDGQGCELDIGCNLIKYVTAPILTVLFGIRQYQDGLHIFPADLVMPITILSCNRMQRNIDESIPPKSNDKRSLALIPCDNDKPLYYRFCRREDGKGCVLDISCNLVKYGTSPITAVLFGIRQLQHGLHVAPADLVPLISILFCNKLQRKFDEVVPPETNEKRSLALSARDDDKPSYRFCRREDGQGCTGDVACAVVKHILVPIQLMLFGEQQLRRGPHIRPAHLAPPIALLLCTRLQTAIDNVLDGPPESNNRRSLTLEAPPSALMVGNRDVHDLSPRRLSTRQLGFPMYEFSICRRDDNRGCKVDVTCFMLKYLYAPLAVILFGIMQLELGPHFGPAMLTPVLAIAICSRIQKYQDAQFDAESNSKRSKTLVSSETYSTALSSAKALMPRTYEINGSPFDAKSELGVLARAPPVNPVNPKYYICRRQDGRGCRLDAACWTLKYVVSPIFVVMFGVLRAQFGVGVNPTVLIPPIWVLICVRLQERQDAEFDAESPTKRSSVLPPLLEAPSSSSSLSLSSALVLRKTRPVSDQTYSFCQEGLNKRCIVDVGCWYFEKIGAKAFFVLWGMIQYQIGPRIGPGILLPYMTIVLCHKIQERSWKRQQPLTLPSKLPPLEELSSSPLRELSSSLTSEQAKAGELVLRAQKLKKPFYMICTKGGRECIVDVACVVVKYALVPTMVVLFGEIMMRTQGSVLSPAITLPTMLFQLCNLPRDGDSRESDSRESDVRESDVRESDIKLN